MTVGIRWRLFALHLALVLAVLLASGFYLAGRLKRGLYLQLVADLEHSARAARLLIASRLQEPEITQADPLADRLGQALGARVTIIAGDGRVLGDSRLTPGQLLRLENHAGRPEVVAARQHGRGLALRYSTTLKTDLLYLALPFQAGQLVGTLRLARSLGSIDDEVAAYYRQLLVAGVLGVLLAVVLALLVAQLVSRPLRRVLHLARLATGDGGAGSGEDLRRLGHSLRKLSRELQQTVEQLGRQRSLQTAVLESIGDGLLVLDGELRVSLHNSAARELLGKEELNGAALAELLRVPELHDLCRQALAGRGGELEFDCQLDKLQRLLATTKPLAGEPGLVVALRDVTELRRLEAVRRDFVANVSHELRTPAGAIRAAAETLQGGALERPEQARRFLDSLVRNSERLGQLLDELLELARCESGVRRPVVGETDIALVVNRLVERLQPLAQERNQQLLGTVAAGTRLRTDERLLEQLLGNLLDNALRHTPAGSRVEVRASDRGERLRLEVCDDGPGIAPDYRRRIFERFFRVDAGRSREQGGAGLGLAIVKHLAENLGGRVGVEPNSPRGSIFWVELPLA